ncbi:MAG: hypothetical protein ABIJ74_02890 [archaeon]
MPSDKMVLPTKQIAFAVIIILALLAVSFLWIQFSNSGNNNSDDLNTSDNNSVVGPHFINLTIVEKNDCLECISLDALVTAIESFDVNILGVKTVDADSTEGKNLIAMHNISKLPVLIVNGSFQETDLQQAWSEIGDESNGVLVLRKVFPPFYSLEENMLVGKVNLLEIKNSSCTDCIDLNFVFTDLSQLGVLFESHRTIEFDSAEAKDLIEFYLIDRIPVVLLGGDVIEYDFITSVWDQVGIIDEDGTFVYNEAVPYYDLFSGETKGLVEVTKLVDANCSDCLDVNLLLLPLNQFGVKITKETTIDVSSEEGKALIEKYLIQKVPTIIVSSEAEEYLDFFVSWPDLGSQEEDGKFVFRNLEAVGQPFKTLE